MKRYFDHAFLFVLLSLVFVLSNTSSGFTQHLIEMPDNILPSDLIANLEHFDRTVTKAASIKITPLPTPLNQQKLVGPRILSFQNNNTLPGYMLVDDITFFPGNYQDGNGFSFIWGQRNKFFDQQPGGIPPLTQGLAPSPFGYPAGGIAIYQESQFYQFLDASFGCHFPKIYPVGTKIAFYLNLKRFYPDFDRDGIAVSILTSNYQSLPIKFRKHMLLCHNGEFDHLERYYANNNVGTLKNIPNNFFGLVEVTIDSPADTIGLRLINSTGGNGYGTGIANLSYLDHIMIKDNSLEVLSVTASPKEINVKADETPKVIFTAEASDPTTINFELTLANGDELSIGSVATQESNGRHFAEISWQPSGNEEDGQATIKASAGDSSKTDVFEIKSSETEIISVIATPKKLFIDPAGQGSGIVFKAVTSEDTEVTFKVKSSSGQETIIGQATTINKIAKLSWWGPTYFISPLAEVNYEIIAETGGSNKNNNFKIVKTAVNIEGLGKWMKAKKDPSAKLPPYAKVEVCPLNSWGEMVGEEPGYFSNISIDDPVNTSSGNFCLPEVDFSIKGRKTFAIARIYNSLSRDITPFGHGWASPIFSRLIIKHDRVTFVNSDNSRILFNKSNGVFTPTYPTPLKLIYNADTTFYSLSHPHGTTWIFDNSGKILRMFDACCGSAANDATIFTYNQANQLTQVDIQSGKYITINYNNENLISSITDSANRVFSYTYDTNSNLISHTDPLGRKSSYTYDSEEGFMTSYTKPGNKTTNITYSERRVVSIKNPTGATLDLEWDFANNSLSVSDYVNKIHTYEFNPNWTIRSYSIPELNFTKTFESENNFLTSLTDSLGNVEQFVYDSNNNYVQNIDKLGNTSIFEWHPELKKLTKKTDPLGRVWKYEWCHRGNLMKKIDPAGNETSYTYDNHNNRTSVTDPLGRITNYKYDTTGNYLLQTVDPAGNISSFTYNARGNMLTSTDKLGRTTSFEYDIIDRLTKTTYPDGRWKEITYDEAGNVASRKDNLNRITQYTYDANGKLLTTVRVDGSIVSHAYDAAGRKIASTDVLGRTASYEYDELDNLVKVTYPDQSVKTYAYDTEKRLVSSTDELGNVTSYEYDPMGRMLATIDPAGSRYENTYDIAGRKIARKDPLERTTSYEYDVLDRTVKTTAPDGTITQNSYDAVGNLLISTNTLNQESKWEYDVLNRQVKAINTNGAETVTNYDAAGQVVSTTNALGNSTTYAYDLAGRKTTTTNALGHVYKFEYDNAGRLVKTIDPMGNVATQTYDIMDRVVSESDALGRITKYEYDVAGRRVAKIDPMGRRSIIGYDLKDRIKTEVDAEGRVVSYDYDAAGRKVSLTDGTGRIWKWIYDSLGRVITEIDPLGNQVKFAYNVVGNKTIKTNARGQNTKYEYDLMNRMVKVTYPDSAIATMAYDLLGRETARSSADGAVEKAYDVAGNLSAETFTNLNKDWTYSYDLLGNKLQAISPEQEVINYSYDKLNRMIKMADAKESIDYAYDELGRVKEEKRSSGVITRNQFDAAGQLLKVEHIKETQSYYWHKCKKQLKTSIEIISSREYAYDLAGNRTSMKDEASRTTQYNYDNSNWLTKVIYPNTDVVAYTYNDAGDRLGEQLNQDPATTYTYDAAGRMLTKGTASYTYDADGNMLTDGEATYQWNSENRLVRVEKAIKGCKHNKYKGKGWGHYKHGKAGIEYEEYTYIPEDWRRITRKAGKIKTYGKHSKETSKTFISVYDGGDESHEYELKKSKFKCWNWKHLKKDKKQDNSYKLELLKTYVSGPYTDDIIFTRSKCRSYAMLKDGLGSTIALTNNSGRTIAKIGYDAWGEFRWPEKNNRNCNIKDHKKYLDRLFKTRGFGFKDHSAWRFGKWFGKKLTPYLYTGRRFSEFTGQYFNRNRYYSPALGRFISKDPVGFNGDINLYRYANNNPLIYVDPWGLSADDCKKEYKDLRLNLIHIYNGSSLFPYNRFKIENAFNFINLVSNFSIVDQPVKFSKTIGLIAWHSPTYNSATIEAFSKFSSPSNANTEIINIILAETNFGSALYGLSSPIGGRRALVDWNNGQHLGNPTNRSWTILHESGHALGLPHKTGTVMQQANWGTFHFDSSEQGIIEQALEKQ